MRGLFLLAVSGLWLGLVPLSAVRGDDYPTLKPLIERGIASAGGREILTKRNVQVLRYMTTVTVGGLERALPGRAVRHVGKRIRVEVEKLVTIGYDGKQGWAVANGMVADLLDEQLRQITGEIRADALTTLVPLGNDQLRLKSLGESRVDDRSVVGFRIEQEGERSVELYLDQETGLVVRRLTEAPSLQEPGKLTKEETLYRDYKRMDGILTPTDIETRQNGKVIQRLKVSEAKYLEQIDDAEFRRPAA